MGEVIVSAHGHKICACHSCTFLRRGWLESDGNGRYSFQMNCLHHSDRAITAHDQRGRLVGVLRYNIYRGTMLSLGTFVAESYRKHGLAKYLWSTALALDRPNKVNVEVVSHKGLTLICAVRKENPEIEWKVYSHGQRKLAKRAKRSKRGAA